MSWCFKRRASRCNQKYCGATKEGVSVETSYLAAGAETMASRWKSNDREAPKNKAAVKNKNIVVQQKKASRWNPKYRSSPKDFHPHFKSEKHLDKNKKSCAILTSCAGYKNKKLCSILISGAESKTSKSKKQSWEKTKAVFQFEHKIVVNASYRF